MQGNRIEKGLEVLQKDADDVLQSTVVSDSGYETLTHGPEGTALSWIEITRTYKISGPVKTRYEVTLLNGRIIAVKSMRIVTSFDLTKKDAVLGAATVSGNRTEGLITITKYTQNYTVGNDLFTKVISYYYEVPVWSDGTNTFEMPSRKYENFTDGGFVLNNGTAVEGFEVKDYVHSVSTTFNGNSDTAKAEEELRMKKVEDKLKDRKVINDGIDQTGDYTAEVWVEVEETYTVSEPKIYIEKAQLVGEIEVEAIITKILASFDLAQAVAILSSETKLAGTSTQGNFVISTYQRTYTVGNDKFTKVFKLKYQKAVYTPCNFSCKFYEFTNVTDKNFTMTDMSKDDTSNPGTEYARKKYVHSMGATFNNAQLTKSTEAIVMVEIVPERETPSWLGNPIDAIYTRTQYQTGAEFNDMLMVRYQFGRVLIPNGDKSKLVIFAYDQATAAKEGVRYSPKDDRVISAVWTGSYWQDAIAEEEGNVWKYTGYNVSDPKKPFTHSVHKNNAITCGIGKDVTFKPKAQSYKIEGTKITISYAVNNGKTTADTSLSIR